MSKEALTLTRVTRFWSPLAGTWLMMSVEGPLLAAVIARMAEPTYNLAAYGVAFSLALIVEAPIIMMLSAATALVINRESYLSLRNFTTALNALVTVVSIALIIPPVFDLVGHGMLGLVPEVSRRAHLALILLIPWPATIGFRRFYQGVMIRYGQPDRVAWGTVVRLGFMLSTVACLSAMTTLDGAAIGAAALSMGVSAEALTSRIMAGRAIQHVLATPSDDPQDVPSLRSILDFYIPLALTSMIALAVHPLVTFFMGHSRQPLESLAVLPVVNSLVFIFRSLGLAAQEVFIALIGTGQQNRAILARFAIILGGLSSAGLAAIAWTPAAHLWFAEISGLSAELTDFALIPAQILAVIPALTVLISWQRAMLVNSGRTGPVTWATVTEIGVAAAVLAIGVFIYDIVGAIVAAAALVIGRISANLYLIAKTPRNPAP